MRSPRCGRTACCGGSSCNRSPAQIRGAAAAFPRLASRPGQRRPAVAIHSGNVLFLRQLVEQEQGAVVAWSTSTAGAHGRQPRNVAVANRGDGAQIRRDRRGVRDVVDLVAVAEPVDRHCLMTLADPLAVEEAEQRELIRTSADAVYVGHPMYAEVRLKQCGALRLRRLRGMVASAIKDGSGTANWVRRGLLRLESDLRPTRGYWHRRPPPPVPAGLRAGRAPVSGR